jgi:hypothetical protein
MLNALSANAHHNWTDSVAIVLQLLWSNTHIILSVNPVFVWRDYSRVDELKESMAIEIKSF